MRTMKTLKKRVTCKKKKPKSNIEAIILNSEKYRAMCLPASCSLFPRGTLLGRKKRRIRIPEVTFIAR